MACSVFSPVNQRKVSTEVARQIEELILEGTLRPGDRLPGERELAETMEVSRPTLRDAIEELKRRGLLVSRHGGGTYVADIMGSMFSQPMVDLFSRHPRATYDFLEYRGELEAIAASWAAVRATEPDREILTRIIHDMEKAAKSDDRELEAKLDVDLHMAIAEASHNLMLIQTIRSIFSMLAEGVFYNRELAANHGAHGTVLFEKHKQIYNAVMSGDPDRAAAEARGHMVYMKGVMREAEMAEKREAEARRRLGLMERPRTGRTRIAKK